MNAAAKYVTTLSLWDHPAFSAMLPEDADERTNLTAAAMVAMIHHGAATSELIAKLGVDRRFNPAMLWEFGKASQQRKADPGNAELIRHPAYTAATIYAEGHFRGDCDDLAVLLAAIAVRLGWNVDLAVSARPGRDWEHVYIMVQDKVGARWETIDPQETDAPLASNAYERIRRYPVWRSF
jgi:hypothetical protein